MAAAVFCGTAILFLLLTIHDDSMKTEASFFAMSVQLAERAVKIRKMVVYARCCAKHCKKDEICAPNLVLNRGCKCFKPDKRYKEGGKRSVFL